MEMFQAWADRRFFDVDRLVDSFGECPADMLYGAFDMLRPGARIAGNIRLFDNLWNDEFVKSYRRPASISARPRRRGCGTTG